MFEFLRKTLRFRTTSLVSLRTPNAGPLRWFSGTSDQAHSFPASYLIKSLGFSEKSALSASKSLKFETPEKPDKVIEVFEFYGFTRTQISTLVRKSPQILVSDANKTIFPKLEFFKSKGVSDPEMAKMVSSHPVLLRTSLDNQIIPMYNFLSDLFRSDELTVAAVKRHPNILGQSMERVVSNVDVLIEHGVPSSNIAYMVNYQPRSFAARTDRYRGAVGEVAEMGFDPKLKSFVVAVFIILANSESSWASKVGTYKRCGFTEDEVLEAFRRDPRCMAVSERKIEAGMGFFVREMAWRPSFIAKRLVVLALALETRIVPRCLVFKALRSKGLVKDGVSLSTLFSTTEDKFLKRFVEPYKKEAPNLLKLYKKKLALEKEYRD